MVHVQKKPVRRGCRVKYGKDSRYAYIMSIAHRMKISPSSLVSGVEGRLFHNVFNHLIDAIVSSHTAGGSEKAIIVDIGSDGCNSLVPLVNRDCLLNKILTLLLCMARRRHYNPPSDSEIVCYREFKRHIRCVIAYHEAGRSEDVQWEYSKDPAGYHSLSCSQTTSAVEELIELTGSLAKAIPQFQEFSQNNGLAGLSPESNEKKSIKTLMDYITSSHLHVKKEYEACDSSVCKPVGATTRKRGIDVLIDDGGEDHFYPLGPLMFTAGYFDRKLVEYMKQLRKSCFNLMLGIMGKLELDGYPVSLFPVDDNNILLEWLKQVKFNRPRNSANDVHRSVLLARYAASLIQGISSIVEDACTELTDMLRRRQHCYEFAPQALLVLLLLDCSAFGKAGEKMATLQDREALNSDCSTSRQCGVTYLNCHSGAESNDNGVKCGDSNTDNVKILATIFQVLKGIGTSDALGAPSPSEVIILDQIMEHVSLCIDGFLCAKAYQKERDLRRIPYRNVDSELARIRANGVPKFLYDGCVFGAEVMSERLKQLQEGFNLVIQALQKVEIS